MGVRDKSAAIKPNGLMAFSFLLSGHFSDIRNVLVSVVMVLAVCFSLGFASPARAAQIYNQWLCTMYYSGVLGTNTVFKEVPITSIEACRAKIESQLTLWWGFPVVASADPLSCSSAHCVQWFTILNPYTGRYNYAYGNAIIYYDRQFSIKLSNDANLPTSGDLAEVEPGKVTTTLRAKVYDNNNQLVPNVDVRLQVTVEANSGGHAHHDNNRPKGTVSPAEGSTGPDGSGHVFTFTAPAPAGDHKITATCTGGRTCTQEGPDQVWVGLKGLVNVPSSGFWELVGNTPIHPANHYLNGDALGKLMDLARLYKQVYFPFDPVLRLNDASLERGGVFDIDWENRDTGPRRTVWWTPPHHEHRRGVVIDIRANGTATAIPQRNFEDFERLLTYLRMSWLHENVNATGGHFHVRLLGVAQ